MSARSESPQPASILMAAIEIATRRNTDQIVSATARSHSLQDFQGVSFRSLRNSLRSDRRTSNTRTVRVVRLAIRIPAGFPDGRYIWMLCGRATAYFPSRRDRYGALTYRRAGSTRGEVVAGLWIVRAGLDDQLPLHREDFRGRHRLGIPEDLLVYREVESLLGMIGDDPRLPSRARTAEVGQRAGQVRADVDLPVGVGDL